MNKGFTLIELLVVVLIIGILAAIALPQYQKAVERSRMAEAIQYLGDYAQAQSIYYMQHNAFAEDIDELNGGDITLSEPGDAFDYEDGISSKSGNAFNQAVRHSGIYADGLIVIKVFPDGSIQKGCEAPKGKAEFCTIAETFGYLPQGNSGNSGGSGNSGSNTDPEEAMLEGPCVDCAAAGDDGAEW